MLSDFYYATGVYLSKSLILPSLVPDPAVCAFAEALDVK